MTLNYKLAVLVYIIFTILGILLNIVGANVAVMSYHFNTTLTQVTILISANAFGRVLTSYVSGVVADKIGRKKVLLLAITLISAMFVGLPFTTNIYIGLILMFMAGMGQGMIDAAGVALIFDIFKKKSDFAVGLVQVFISLGIFLAPALSSILYEYEIFFGYFFWGIGIVCIVVLFSIIIIKFPPISASNSNEQIYNNTFKVKPKAFKEGLIVASLVFLFSMFVITLTTWISTYSSEVIGLSISESIRVLTAYSVGCIFGGIIISRLLTKLHSSTFLVINPVAMLLPLSIYTIFKNPNTALILFVIVGFFGGIVIGLALALTGELFTDNKATASGAVMTSGAIGTLLTPIITGFIFNNYGIQAVYNFMLAILILFIIVAIIFKLRYKAIKN